MWDLRMNKFLLCLELEMAGFVLGGLSAIGFGTAYIFLATVAFFGWFLGGVIRPSESLIHQLYIILEVNWFFFLYLFYCFVMMVAGIQLIRGTRKQNHHHTRFFLVMLVFGIVATPAFTAMRIESILAAAIVIAWVVIAHCYSFLSIYSLHHKFKTAANYELLA